MIVCSCNVISDQAIRACLDSGPESPRTPGQVQRCLGCRPQCGSCFATISSLIDQTLVRAGAFESVTCAAELLEPCELEAIAPAAA
jgi:bacterioferritin-associated ferredoxin